MDSRIEDEDGLLKDVSIYMFKVLVLGEAGVGKTSFVRRYVNGQFSENYKATIGVDFSTKAVNWTEKDRVDIFLWDLAGQERIRTQVQSMFRETHGAVFVYDITRSQESNNIEEWKELLDEKCTLRGEQYKCPCILLVNKCDLVEGIDIDQIDAMAKSYGFIGAYPISVKVNFGIDDAMKALLIQLIKAQRVQMAKSIPALQEIDTVKLQSYKENKGSGCWC